MSLAHFYAVAYLQNGNFPEGLNFMERFTYAATESPMDERSAFLLSAVNRLSEDFGTWNIPWGEISRFQRLNGDIDLDFDDNEPSIPVGLASGNWGSLAAYGMRGQHDNVKKIYGTRGNSFVAVVEFGEKVKAKTMLAGGQSGDPLSLHFYDQAQRYADVQFKDVPYYRADVEERTEETYQPGKRQ